MYLVGGSAGALEKARIKNDMQQDHGLNGSSSMGKGIGAE